MRRLYKIAGLITEMDTYGRTALQGIPYEIPCSSGVEPNIIIQPDVMEAKRRFPTLTDADCEYMTTARDFFGKLLNYDGLRLHSSAVILDGKAYLFTAPSGTGKSTHVCIWRQVFGDARVRIINDDKPALRLENGIWYAYGTPWSGKTGQNLNLKAPLAGIAVIERGEQNEIERFSGRDAIRAIYKQSTKTEDPALLMKLLELLDQLMVQVPVWKLRCNMEPEAAIVAYEAMSGQKYEGDWK